MNQNIETNQRSISGGQTPATPVRKRVRLWFLVGVIAVALIVGTVLIMSDWGPGLNDPSLVATTKPDFGVVATSSLKTRLWSIWFRLNEKFRRPNPGTYTFPSTSDQRCSIHGLLNQCTAMSGVRYLIDKNVATGTVNFGHTNALKGSQWIAAFENALQTGQPEWYVSEMNQFRKENLVLVRYDSKTVVVLPKERAANYRTHR